MKRRGIASIVGTLFFTLTFLAAAGAFTYIQSTQIQYNEAVQNAQALVAQRQRESLTFQPLPNGTLAVRNWGASSSQIVATILKFGNGSVFSLSESRFVGTGSLEGVSELIPGTASCGTSGCAGRYSYLLGSTNQGDAVGVVTSLGNAFWLNPPSALKGTVVLIYDDESPGIRVSSNVETVSMNYSLASNAYSRIIVECQASTLTEAFGYNGFGGSPVTVRLYIGSSSTAFTDNIPSDYWAPGLTISQSKGLTFSAVQQSAAIVEVTVQVGTSGIGYGQVLSLRVYGVV